MMSAYVISDISTAVQLNSDEEGGFIQLIFVLVLRLCFLNDDEGKRTAISYWYNVFLMA